MRAADHLDGTVVFPGQLLVLHVQTAEGEALPIGEDDIASQHRLLIGSLGDGDRVAAAGVLQVGVETNRAGWQGWPLHADQLSLDGRL